MAHIYEVHTSAGRAHQVDTHHHHGDHSDEQFKALLLQIIGQAAGRVAGEVIVRIIYKGRR